MAPSSARPELGEPAPDVALRADGEREVRLSEEWSRGPLVLIFLRHFG